MEWPFWGSQQLRLEHGLLGINGILLMVMGVLLIILVRRKCTDLFARIQLHVEMIEAGQARLERILREEIAANREETSSATRHGREEISNTLNAFANSLQTRIAEMAGLQRNQLDGFSRQQLVFSQNNEQTLERLRETVEDRLMRIQQENTLQLQRARETSLAAAKELREELGQSLRSLNGSVLMGMSEMGGLLKDQMEAFSSQLRRLTESNENKLESVRTAVEARLKQIQDDNARQLDQMRATVDERLQGTLEQRLSESFRHVSERLEQVHKGLGEMQTLATGVGDLKRMLTNVKTRGGWGEIQLHALLDQLLTPEQYERNVRTREITGEAVEFAIRLPGRGNGDREAVWLPIDAKFPMEDYQRLVEAQERGDVEASDSAAKALMVRIRGCAREIRDKYLCPPTTTDFGIMFLPVEGLYAEVVRKPGLVEEIQRECRVVIAGPTTLAALLNSLQMGFRTLAIQQRSGEVWKLLGAVKTEFGKFGDALAGVKKKLDQASNTMDDAAKRSRIIERKLRSIEELPSNEAHSLLTMDIAETDTDSQ